MSRDRGKCGVCQSVGACRISWMLPLNNRNGLGAVSEIIIVASFLVSKKNFFTAAELCYLIQLLEGGIKSFCHFS